MFYGDKGPAIKPKISGYTISNTGGLDSVTDPTKTGNPGVGQYETKYALEKTTFEKGGHAYSVPQAGSYSIELLMSRAASPSKKEKKAKA